ncbi:MAG TPA: hypothetical protein VG368_04940 [Acidimicrobiales bacterium]|jgi:hypothetical protein|nr:hypothetical protein [Acidimicrobiales bacterium]
MDCDSARIQNDLSGFHAWDSQRGTDRDGDWDGHRSGRGRRDDGHFRYEHGTALNDLVVTPGETMQTSATVVCRAGYASSVRHVTSSEKAHVYAEYGVFTHVAGQFEVDHLISLELGGGNAVTNLWPEPNDHPPGYLNSKDELENRLHALVCDGSMSLLNAQRAIASDWVATFRRIFGRWPSASTALRPATMPTRMAGRATSTTAAVTARSGRSRPESPSRSARSANGVRTTGAIACEAGPPAFCRTRS